METLLLISFREIKIPAPLVNSAQNFEPYNRYGQCCGSGMFIPDPVQKDFGSASKNLSICKPKTVFKLSEK
jgi:hypothetical protein